MFIIYVLAVIRTSAIQLDPAPQIYGINVHTDHLRREQLVGKLDDLVKNNTVVIISAPMGSGKTSLLQLYNAAKTDVYKFLYYPMSRMTPADVMIKLGITRDDELDSNSVLKTEGTVIVMVDDCQLYFENDYTWFWEYFTRSTLRPSNVRFILSSTRTVSFLRESPICFGSEARLKMEDLLLTKEEAHELISMKAPVGLDEKLRHEVVLQMLVNECDGLLAALRISITNLNGAFRLATDSTQKTVVQAYFSSNFVSCFDRCFIAQPNHINPVIIPVLVELFTQSISVANIDTVRPLLRAGILAECSESRSGTLSVRFASPLASRFIMHVMFPNRGSKLPTSLPDLVKAAIGVMSATTLRQSISIATDKPKEAVYQHMFMHALHECTPATVLICPELSRVFPDINSERAGLPISGEIDFYLDSQLHWGIELMVNGSDIGGHMKRFEHGGDYAPLGMNDYAIVDFRKGPVKSLRKRHSKRITVFLDETFSTCTVLEGFNNSVTIELKP